MNIKHYSKLFTFVTSFVVGIGLGLSSFQALSEDIDIFSVDQDDTVNKPNVLIILDNSANWSRQAQQWPGGLSQGQSEVRAIKEVINSLADNSVNVGLLEYRTQGSSNDTDNAYLRYHIRPMNAANKPVLAGELDTIFNNINAPVEKRGQGNPFGNLFWDAYNYLSSDNSIVAGAGTPSTLADSAAYNSLYDNFRSPLASSDTCTRTIIIFIANNTSSGPTDDSAENVAALTALNGGTTPSQIPFAEYSITTTTETALQGYTTSCYTSKANCTSVENALCTGSGMDSCACTDAGIHPPPVSCGTDKKFTVYGRGTSESIDSTDSPGVTTNGASTGEASKCQNNNPGSYSCPLDSTISTPGPGPNQRTEKITTWSSCSYQNVPDSCGNNNNKDTWNPIGDKNVTTTVYTQTNTDTMLGSALSCSTNAAGCDVTAYADCVSLPNATYDTCYCAAPSDPTGCPASGNSYEVLGTFTSTEALPTGNFVPAPAGPFMVDEWAQHLRNVGVPLPGTSPAINAQVTTYTIDVFNAQQNADHSALLFNTARVGGGKYYQAKDENQIKAALNQIFSEVQAVNSAFSSASLPVNATNRAQNENQVFIGLFRPDNQKAPRWFGNLKRYQLIQSGASIELGDQNGDPAINDLTGFITDCAVSYWTTDTGDYWLDVGIEYPPAVGKCAAIPNSADSDLPDGPFVEKGAAAEVLRKGNDPDATADTVTGNYALNRNLETLSGSSLVEFNEANSGGYFDASVDADVKTVKFTQGEDIFDHDSDTETAEPRANIHGDVIHSRPQPINYGGTMGVVVFYGSNDGTFKAVKAETGEEVWSFIAPEHFSKLARLKNNSPNIRFSGDALPSTPKDYFFDGSTGVYQTFNADDTADDVWIYPSMRRGGRMTYAFNVSDPDNPVFLWKQGCPNPAPDTTDCTATEFEDSGQLWSQSKVAFIKGYSETFTPKRPVIIYGGGYDTCEDADTRTPACASANGSSVYVLDALTGALVKKFSFGGRSVVADIALTDINFDEMVDFAFAADTGGNIYRMDFVDSSYAPLVETSWSHLRIAHTDGDGRKFIFTPAIVRATDTKVYLAIGSGDREHPLLSDYPVDEIVSGSSIGPVINRFYVFKNTLTDTTTDIDLDDTTVMTDNTTASAGTCAAPGIVPSSSQAGWFIDLTEHGDGEQVVTSAVVAAGAVIFSTNRATPPSTTACTNSLGEARGYTVSLLNGSGAIGVSGSCGGDRSSEFVGGGLPPSPVISTVPIDGVVKTIVIGAPQKDGTVSSSIEAQEVTVPIASIRRPVYWFKTGDTD